MKKWSVINKVTKILLVLLLIPYLYYLAKGIWYEANGIYLAIPGPALFKWYEIFLFEVIPYAVYSIFFIIADIVLMIISRRKAKKYLE